MADMSWHETPYLFSHQADKTASWGCGRWQSHCDLFTWNVPSENICANKIPLVQQTNISVSIKAVKLKFFGGLSNQLASTQLVCFKDFFSPRSIENILTLVENLSSNTNKRHKLFKLLNKLKTSCLQKLHEKRKGEKKAPRIKVLWVFPPRSFSQMADEEDSIFLSVFIYWAIKKAREALFNELA